MRANCLAEHLELGLKLNHKKNLDEKFCLDAKLEVIEVGIPIFQLIPYVNYIGNPSEIQGKSWFLREVRCWRPLTSPPDKFFHQDFFLQ